MQESESISPTDNDEAAPSPEPNDHSPNRHAAAKERFDSGIDLNVDGIFQDRCNKIQLAGEGEEQRLEEARALAAFMLKEEVEISQKEKEQKVITLSGCFLIK